MILLEDCVGISLVRRYNRVDVDFRREKFPSPIQGRVGGMSDTMELHRIDSFVVRLQLALGNARPEHQKWGNLIPNNFVRVNPNFGLKR
jgi:hypothetical protein